MHSGPRVQLRYIGSTMAWLCGPVRLQADVSLWLSQMRLVRLFMPLPLACDTSPGAEAQQIAFFQQRRPHERLAIVSALAERNGCAATRAAVLVRRC